MIISGENTLLPPTGSNLCDCISANCHSGRPRTTVAVLGGQGSVPQTYCLATTRSIRSYAQRGAAHTHLQQVSLRGQHRVLRFLTILIANDGRLAHSNCSAEASRHPSSVSHESTIFCGDIRLPTQPTTSSSQITVIAACVVHHSRASWSGNSSPVPALRADVVRVCQVTVASYRYSGGPPWLSNVCFAVVTARNIHEVRI